jgi:hypothetical protein
MKNNLGQTLTVKVIRNIWQDCTADPNWRGTYTRKQWLDEKAMETFYQRLKTAEDKGASDNELQAINSQDVRYTFLDEIKRIAWNAKVGQFLMGLYHWMTDEPDYSSLYPYG